MFYEKRAKDHLQLYPWRNPPIQSDLARSSERDSRPTAGTALAEAGGQI